MQTRFSKTGSPSFFFTNLREIWGWNCEKAFNSFIVQYSK
jgi:hypothetical protein